MKIVFVSASDRIGGAAGASYRLFKAVQCEGLQVEMLVLRKVSADPNVHRLSAYLNRWQRARRRLSEQQQRSRLNSSPRTSDSGYWSLNLFGYPIADAINSYEADVVHLNWVGDNFLPIGEISKIKASIIWSLHDMWAFTGGCHTAYDCVKYEANCGNCPQLIHSERNDISWLVQREKQRSWSAVPMTIVCPSRWLADCARRSFLLRRKRIKVIPYTLDLNVFKPLEKAEARRAFNLPLDKKLILFGAIGGTSDPHKGYRFLQEALDSLQDETNVELVVFGGEQEADLNLRLTSHQIGRLQDEVSLSLLYSACDVYVLPSLQESLPQTLIEALACGTPCVAFDGSGPTDLLRHCLNGYMARLRDSQDLLAGIEWVLAQSWSRQKLHQEIAERHNSKIISAQYIQLYQSLLARS